MKVFGKTNMLGQSLWLSVLYGESMASSRLACLGLIVTGILGLKFLGE